MTEAKLRPELEKACTLGLQPEPLPPFVSLARRPHVPSQPKSAPAALATATAALAQSAAPKFPRLLRFHFAPQSQEIEGKRVLLGPRRRI